jgi:hypothetical protein
MTQQFASRGRRSSAVELALRLVRDGASPADAAKVAGCHVRSVHRALKPDPKCPECKGTGLRDHGGVYPMGGIHRGSMRLWGEA